MRDLEDRLFQFSLSNPIHKSVKLYFLNFRLNIPLSVNFMEESIISLDNTRTDKPCSTCIRNEEPYLIRYYLSIQDYFLVCITLHIRYYLPSTLFPKILVYYEIRYRNI